MHSSIAASRFRRNLGVQDLTALGLGVYFHSLVLWSTGEERVRAR